MLNYIRDQTQRGFRLGSRFRSKLMTFIFVHLLLGCCLLPIAVSFGSSKEVIICVSVTMSADAVVLFILAWRKVTLSRSRAGRFLAWALGNEAADEVSGDLEEVYLRERDLLGEARARRRYRRALFSLIGRRFWNSAVRLAMKRRA